MRGRLVAAVSHACPLGRPPSEGASPLARWGSLPIGRPAVLQPREPSRPAAAQGDSCPPACWLMRSAVLQPRVHRFSRFVRFY